MTWPGVLVIIGTLSLTSGKPDVKSFVLGSFNNLLKNFYC